MRPADIGGPADRIDENLETSRSAIEERLGTDLENEFPDDASQPGARTGADAPATPSDWASVGSGGREDGDYNLEAFVSAAPTLADHLAEQLSLAIADPVRRMIGQYLIDMVDEAGYLTGDLASVAEKLGAPLGRSRGGARPSCRASIRRACARAISPNAWRSSSRSATASIRRWPRWSAVSICWPSAISRALRRICGVGDEDLAEMIAEIRNLNPKPGLAFGFTQVQPIVPDVYVRPGPDGGFIVELNSDTLPKILVNQRYHAELSKNAKADSAKTYLAENLQSATWLMRALDQRAKTILKVAMEIVKQQDAFFVHGVQHLRPLNLKTIADAISMHESTVSRVTANKYIATNRGIFELKYFFTSSIASSDGGDAHSAEAVRDRIKHLIEAESANDVLSDDTIVERLREAGIDIARRTVAKYREAMRIPSSVQRRRDKLAMV